MMAATDLNFDDVDELAALLEAAGIPCAGVELDHLDPPGVWLRPRAARLDHLGGSTLVLDLVLVAPGNGARRAMDVLAGLLNEVTRVLAPLGGPTGDISFVTVSLPGGGAPLPAMVVPLDLLTTQE